MVDRCGRMDIPSHPTRTERHVDLVVVSSATGNNIKQVVRTHVSLPSSSIIWYQCKSGAGKGRLWKRSGLLSIMLDPSAGFLKKCGWRNRFFG